MHKSPFAVYKSSYKNTHIMQTQYSMCNLSIQPVQNKSK